MRDRDANTAWAIASADGVLEERRVYCQNWRGDVSAVITDTGKMVEWVKYSAYGIPFELPCGNTDSDGDWDATDSAAIAGTLDARKDCNLDGTISAADVTQANAITGGYQTLGRTVLTSAAVANRKGYAGYENDGSIWRLDHVRHRVFHKELGRWTQRDPLGYVDGKSLYEYVGGRAVLAHDSMGLATDIGIGIGTPCNPGGGGSHVIVLMGMGSCQPWYEYDPIEICEDKCKHYKHDWTMDFYFACMTGCKASRWPPHPNKCAECMQYENSETRATCYEFCGEDPHWHSCLTDPNRQLRNTECSIYPPGESYKGARLRCFCGCMGNSAWEQFVRACLQCAFAKYGKGPDWENIHNKCIAAADKHFPGKDLKHKLLTCWTQCQEEEGYY